MILFDLSRLIARAGRETPTGIDRVELAYAERLIAEDAPLCPVMMTVTGRFGLLPVQQTRTYVASTAASWRGDPAAPPPAVMEMSARRLRAAALLRGERALAARFRLTSSPAIYLLVSHHHLEKRAAIARLKERTGARFVCLIHDLIPMEFPEYARAGQADRHRRRMESAAALADGVIVNSRVTHEAFYPVLDRARRAPPMVVAPLGITRPLVEPRTEPAPVEPAYFVCVATIEPRKNHLLLLNLWRQLAAEYGHEVPRLVLVGQRGWEIENVVDMLERCPALGGIVLENSRLPDREMTRLISGARALLLPSFAEGFGFPVAEALAQGVPVLCSDIPALRETGGGVPEYLDPLDGPGWRAAILDYADPASPRRKAQLRRLAGWKHPSWEDHFAAAFALIAEAATGSIAQPAPTPPRRVAL